MRGVTPPLPPPPPIIWSPSANVGSVGKKEKGEGKVEGGKGEGKRRERGRKKEGKGKGKRGKRERRKKGEEGGRKGKEEDEREGKGKTERLLLSAILILGSSFNWPLMYDMPTLLFLYAMAIVQFVIISVTLQCCHAVASGGTHN